MVEHLGLGNDSTDLVEVLLWLLAAAPTVKHMNCITPIVRELRRGRDNFAAFEFKKLLHLWLLLLLLIMMPINTPVAFLLFHLLVITI